MKSTTITLLEGLFGYRARVVCRDKNGCIINISITPLYRDTRAEAFADGKEEK